MSQTAPEPYTFKGFAPPARVAAPVRRALPFGLFSVLPLTENTTDRWEGGEVYWEDIPDNVAAVYVDQWERDDDFARVYAGGADIGRASAFTVYGAYKCGMAATGEFSASERSEAVLLAREEQAVEAHLWETMDDDTPIEIAPDTLSPRVSLARTEEWIAKAYGSLGVIHVSREGGVLLTDDGLISASGGQMQTALGTPVAVGAGYPGSNGTGTLRMFATGAMLGYRSEIMSHSGRLGDLINIKTNDFYGQAERNYLVGYDVVGPAYTTMSAE